MDWKIVLITLIVIMVLCKFLINAIDLIRIDRFIELYDTYTRSTKRDKDWEKIKQKVLERKYIIINILNRVGIHEPEYSFRSDNGEIGPKAGIFHTLEKLINIDDMALPGMVSNHLIEARGILKFEMWNAINPLYWIFQIVWLPQKLLMYLGFRKESILVKAMEVVYWATGIFKLIFEILKEFK